MSINFERRRFMTGALACGCTMCVGGPTSAQDADRGYCSDMRSNADPRKLTPLVQHSDPALIAHIRDERPLLKGFFTKDADIYLDPTDQGAYMNAYYNYIAVGEPFVDAYTNKKYGLLGLSGVMAHEEGHIFQTAWNVDLWLKNVRGYRVKFVELHADYLAGWYMAWREQYRPGAPAEVAALFFDLGNGFSASANFHGTRQERYLAFQQGYGGFQTAASNGESPDVYVAAASGIKFLQGMLKTSWGK